MGKHCKMPHYCTLIYEHVHQRKMCQREYQFQGVNLLGVVVEITEDVQVAFSLMSFVQQKMKDPGWP